MVDIKIDFIAQGGPKTEDAFNTLARAITERLGMDPALAPAPSFVTLADLQAAPSPFRELEKQVEREIARAILGPDADRMTYPAPETVRVDASGNVYTPDGIPVGVVVPMPQSTAITPEEVRRAVADLEAARRAREAPLVALVDAVPSWADPVAWRAAVLAVDERCVSIGSTIKEEWTWSHARYLQAFVEGDEPAPLIEDRAQWSFVDIAINAYRRALTPAPKVRPERRDRGPRIVVDRGEDE